MRKRDYGLVGLIVAVISVITGVAVPVASDWFSNSAAVDHIYIS